MDLRELVSKKYYVQNFAYGYSNGRHNLMYGDGTPGYALVQVFLHQFSGSNETFWDETLDIKRDGIVRPSYEKYHSAVDAYAAIQRVVNKDRNEEYRLWNFGPHKYEIIEEKVYREVESSILDNEAVIAEYQLFNQQMTQDLKDQFVSIKPISDSNFIQFVKKEELQAETKFDRNALMEKAKRMAEMAGFDGPIEGMLEDE